MHIKNRGRLACLYRSEWVRKGAEGNAHGYAVQHYVGSLPVDSSAVPESLKSLLTSAELEFIDRKVCQPARDAVERTQREAMRREADPLWRLAEAERLVRDAAERSQRQKVSGHHVQRLREALSDVGVFGAAERPPQAKHVDPLGDALDAIRSAAVAVRAGAIGSAPESGARTTRAYALWGQIVAEVDGTADSSLLAALQERRFVKRRRG